MTLRQYLTIMLLGTALCWTSWVYVIINIDPETGSTVAYLFFYISLLMALIGTISFLSFFLYKLFQREKIPIYRLVKKSFRDGLVVALLLVLLLFMQSRQLLNFWGILLLALVILFIGSLGFASLSRSAK